MSDDKEEIHNFVLRAPSPTTPCAKCGVAFGESGAKCIPIDASSVLTTEDIARLSRAMVGRQELQREAMALQRMLSAAAEGRRNFALEQAIRDKYAGWQPLTPTGT